MALGKRLINTGAAAAACLTETTDIFGDSSGVALYSLDYDASDAGGLYDGSPTDVDFGVGGQINYGARFNGSSSNINLGNTNLGITDDANFSISYWFNTNSTTANQGIFWSQNRNGNGARFGSGINLPSPNGGNGSIYFGCTTTSTIYINSGSSSYSANTWYHVVGVKSSSASTGINAGITLYVNGTQVANNASVTQSASGSAATDNSIGSYGGTGSFFNGDLDQVRIFNRALTSTEVSTLYAETACVYTSTTDIVNYPTGTTPIAYYKLDNSSEDYSTGGNDGTDTNIEYRFGRFGQAAVFNGSSSYIDSNLQMPSTTTFTFSCWFNKDNSSANYHLIGDFDSSGTLSSGRFRVQLDSTGNISVGVGNGTSMDFSEFTPSVSLNNIWRHIAVTIDGTSVKAYIDGSQVGTTDTSLYSLASGVNDFAIGAYHPASGKQNFDGKIDQVRIYDAVLTSDQVTELYNEKPEVDTSNFKTVLYDGAGANEYISNVGFQPDLVWIKRRNSTNAAVIQDSVRGANNYLIPSSTAAEVSNTAFDSFDTNGFSLTGNGGSWNNTAGTYVAWNWKGGGDAVPNTDGSNITSQVSANQDGGFSIVSYTGTGVASHTVGHGLNNKPELIILKRTSSAMSWFITSSQLGNNEYLTFTNTAKTTDAGSSGVPSSVNNNDDTTFGFRSGSSSVDNVNQSGGTFIAYCFHSVSGYSKIGSYEGNGTTRNVDLGFNPNWIMIKNADTGSTAWNIVDTRRDTDTTLNLFLQANTSIAEANTTICSLITDGFSVTGTNTFNNSSGDTFIYMAFK